MAFLTGLQTKQPPRRPACRARGKITGRMEAERQYNGLAGQRGLTGSLLANRQAMGGLVYRSVSHIFLPDS